jgi:hypothetical protein
MGKGDGDDGDGAVCASAIACDAWCLKKMYREWKGSGREGGKEGGMDVGRVGARDFQEG